MTRSCTVCQHKQVEEINKQLINGTPLRNIAEQFAISSTSLHRHKESHIPVALLKSKEITDLADADNLARFLQIEYNDIKTIKDQAIADGDNELALKAIDRSLKTIEIVAKVAGLIHDQQINVTQINITQNPEWVELRTLIINTLRPYPDAREAIIDALQ
jgi:hypothetical protein